MQSDKEKCWKMWENQAELDQEGAYSYIRFMGKKWVV